MVFLQFLHHNYYMKRHINNSTSLSDSKIHEDSILSVDFTNLVGGFYSYL